MAKALKRKDKSLSVFKALFASIDGQHICCLATAAAIIKICGSGNKNILAV